MANNKVYTESVVTLNNQEATARLEEIRKKAADVRAEMIRLEQEKGINSKEFKAAKKELIALEKSQRAINEDTKKYERILKDLNGSNLNDLQFAARKLNQEVRRLKPGTEEFVEASKKLKEVRTRMKEIESQSRQTQGVFGSFFTKIGWKAIWAAAAAAVIKLGKDMIAQTQLIGDKWRTETAGWKAAYGTFIADLSSGKGWNEMVQRMKDAYKNGKEVARMLDEIFERNNSVAIQEAELNLEAEQQKKIYMDGTKTVQERIAAAERYDDIQREIAEHRKIAVKEELDAYKSRLQERTNLSDAELDAFIRDYNDNKDLIDQAIEYTEELHRREKAVQGWKDSMNMGDVDGVAADILQANLDAAQESLDFFKASADASVVYWAATVEKYNLGNDEMVKNYVQARIKMIDADTNYERATQRSSRVTSNLRHQLASDGQNAANKAYQDAVKKSEEHFKELQNQAKQAYLSGELTEQQYQNRLTEIQEASLKDRIAIAERFNQSTVELQSQLLDLSIQQKQQLQKMMEDLERDAAKALEDAMAEMDAEIQAEMDRMDQEMQDWLDRWTELCEQSEEVRRELHPVDALRADLQEELNALTEVYQNGLLSEEDYQAARADIVKKYNKEILKAQAEPYQKGVQNAQKYIEAVSNFMTAMQSAATAKLDAQMQAELTAAGDNAEKREEIEANYEQKKLDIQKRYANINMGIEIAKTIAAGALSVMQGFAELGPIGGAIFAAIIAATTALQVATIVAQRNAIMNQSVSSSGTTATAPGNRVATGFSGGGFTDKDPSDTTPVGIVHANEWVAPAAMVRANPITFARLEAVRRSGNYSSEVEGFADGGETTPGTVQAPEAALDNELLKKASDLMQQILDALPFPCYMVLSSLNAKQELDADINSIVSKG